MPIYGRFFSPKDLRLMESFNNELLEDIIQVTVTLFKISPVDTETNIYGETDNQTGKIFFPGVNLVCLVDSEETSAPLENFGPDRSQNSIFKFKRSNLINVNLYPEIGDLVYYNTRYFEIDNVVDDNQFLGGQPTKVFSITVHTHYTRLSSINLVSRQL